MLRFDEEKSITIKIHGVLVLSVQHQSYDLLIMTYFMWAPSVLLGAESRSGPVPKPKWQTCFLITPTPPAQLAIKHAIAGDAISADTFINLLVKANTSLPSPAFYSPGRSTSMNICVPWICVTAGKRQVVFLFFFGCGCALNGCLSLLVDAVTTIACCQKASLSIDGHLNDKFGLSVFVVPPANHNCHDIIFCHMAFMARVIGLK